MQTFDDHLRELHHSESDPLVRKLGGSTASRIIANVERLRGDEREGMTAVVLSALRCPAARLTESYLGIAERLSNRELENIHFVPSSIRCDMQDGLKECEWDNTNMELKYIRTRIKALLDNSGPDPDMEYVASQMNGSFDTMKRDEQFIRMRDTRKRIETFVNLYGCNLGPNNLASTFQVLLEKIFSGEQYSIRERGADRILAMDDGQHTILGQGEIQTVKLYDMLLNHPENPPTGCRDHSDLRLHTGVFDVEGFENSLHQYEDIGRQRDVTRGMLACHLRECSNNGQNPFGGPITLIPGYLPHTARSMGYSDVTAMETALALRYVQGSQVVCSVEKDLPVLDSLLDGQCVAYLDCEDAVTRFSVGGSAEGVVHPDAIRIAEQEDIPIIVHNPMQQELGATLIYH